MKPFGRSLRLLSYPAFIKNELSSSQKQAVIKLIEKLDRDKRFIKNWRPISLLNVDTKIISKVLSGRIKEFSLLLFLQIKPLMSTDE